MGLCKGSAVPNRLRHTAVGDRLASFALGKAVLCSESAAVNDTVDCAVDPLTKCCHPGHGEL